MKGIKVLRKGLTKFILAFLLITIRKTVFNQDLSVWRLTVDRV